MKAKNIGIDVKVPKESCVDQKCPFHGSLKLRGKSREGVIIKKDLNRSATVEFHWRSYLPKYERFQKKRSKLHCHNPACINAKVGDQVLIVECRKISKTKSFVITEVKKE